MRISTVAKEVLAEAIKAGAPKIILVHNHPSGDSTPSNSDYHITDRIYECAELFGIQLLDHVIIGDRNIRKLNKKIKITERIELKK